MLSKVYENLFRCYMKKSLLVVIILLFAVSLINAKDMFSFSSKGNSIEIQFENNDEPFSLESENAFTTIALPQMILK